MSDKAQRLWAFRLVAEGVVIVASILLAFAIDTWWEDRQERQQEKRLLLALNSEFEDNLAKIGEKRAFRQAVVSSIMRLFDASTGKDSLSASELDSRFGDMVWWARTNFETGALDSILLGGKLSMIDN